MPKGNALWLEHDAIRDFIARIMNFTLLPTPDRVFLVKTEKTFDMQTHWPGKLDIAVSAVNSGEFWDPELANAANIVLACEVKPGRLNDGEIVLSAAQVAEMDEQIRSRADVATLIEIHHLVLIGFVGPFFKLYDRDWATADVSTEGFEDIRVPKGQRRLQSIIQSLAEGSCCNEAIHVDD